MQNNWIIFFSTGMVAGGVVGYFICKKRYHIVKAEPVETPVILNKEENVKDYKEKVYEASYKQEEKEGDEDWDEAEKVNPAEPEMVPYVISPEAFASEHSDYAKLTVVYYEDNEVLLDEEEECMDVGSTIGYDAINHFGEYEKDACFIRNERLGNDYEVLLEHRAYEGPGGE